MIVGVRPVVQIKGSVADVDGQLVPGDQILVVNGVDVRSSQQQDTAAMLKVHDAFSSRDSLKHSSRIRFLRFFENPKTRLFTFFEVAF